MSPTGFIAAMTSSTALVIVTFTQIMTHRIILNNPDDPYKIGFTYRKLQVFVRICNGAFKNYIWGTSQFFGGAGCFSRSLDRQVERNGHL